MAGLWKKFNDQGLHIVGIEAQGSAAPAISEMAKAKGMGYQLTLGGELKGARISGIPHGFLFAADGTLAVDDPRGKVLEDKIKELLKEAVGAMAGPGPYVKLAPLAAQIKTGVGLGSVLKMLVTKKASKDAAEAAEATMMYDALHGCAQDSLDSAIAKKADDPLVALTKLDKLALQFSGDEIGTKAAQESTAMKKDPAVRKEIDADMMWRQIEAASDKLKPIRGGKDPKDEAFKKLNLSAIQGIIAGCQSLDKRYPGTSAAKKAAEMMDEYR